MFLKKMCAFLAATFIAVAAFAQQPASPPNPRIVLQQPDKTVTYASAADVTALIARAKKERKEDIPLVVGKILQLDPYTVYLEYRPSRVPHHEPVGLHQKVAELVYVIQGSGTLVTGGKASADLMRIDGGESHKVSKGDFIFIPEHTPHWITHVDRTLVLMSVHVPRPVPTQ